MSDYGQILFLQILFLQFVMSSLGLKSRNNNNNKSYNICPCEWKSLLYSGFVDQTEIIFNLNSFNYPAIKE